MGEEGFIQSVDPLAGGVLTEADAKGTGSVFFGQAQRGNHMAGPSPVAGAAGGDADTLAPQFTHQILAGIARQRQAQYVPSTFTVGMDKSRSKA